MSSYLAFGLDDLKLVPDAARSAGISEAEMGYGLLRTLDYCWTAKTETVAQAHLRGFFGGDLERVAGALCAFGYLSADGEVWRVKGAERFSRVRDARVAAAHAANAARTQMRRKSHANATQTVRKGDGLTASSEQRAANSEQRITASAARELAAGETAPAQPALQLDDEATPDASGMRWQDGIDAATNAFRDARGAPYELERKALKPLKELVKKHGWPEVLSRWRRGLGAEREWYRVSSLSELVANWNRLATEPPAPPGPVRDIRRGYAYAPAEFDAEEFEANNRPGVQRKPDAIAPQVREVTHG